MLFRVLPISACLILAGCADNLAPDAVVQKPSVDEPDAVDSDASTSETGFEERGGGDSSQNETQQVSQTSTETSSDLPSQKVKPVKYNSLSEFEEWVILRKGTERAFVGEYTDTEDTGTYICRRCNTPLYKSDHKFHSNCGWPAFDDEIKGAVERKVDADGYRVEILCKNCGGHLGHVFEGEQFTAKNVRHCVNSVSMKLIRKGDKLPDVILAKDVEAAAKGTQEVKEKALDNPSSSEIDGSAATGQSPE